MSGGRKGVHGRLSDGARVPRDQVETALMLLANMLVDVDELALRTKNAMRRSAEVTDLLGPAVDRIMALQADLIQAQEALKAFWDDGQRRKWHE